jgi:hypothetical protein
MRDFRDAKAMARTLRSALAAKGLKISNSDSLELIAQAFGLRDWNTLSATLQSALAEPAKAAEPTTPPPIEGAVRPLRSEPIGFSRNLEETLHRAIAFANQRKHQYATPEHVLLALADDPDAIEVLKACDVDMASLKVATVAYLDTQLSSIIVEGSDVEAAPTASFQRVVQRAFIHVQNSGRGEVTGPNVLVAIFSESESHAARLLQEQKMTRYDAVNFIAHGIPKGGGTAAA